jgi:hypothetical protein
LLRLTILECCELRLDLRGRLDRDADNDLTSSGGGSAHGVICHNIAIRIRRTSARFDSTDFEYRAFLTGPDSTEKFELL